MADHRIVRDAAGEHLAVFNLYVDELRGIADALGHHDTGAQEMLRAAEAIEAAAAEATR